MKIRNYVQDAVRRDYLSNLSQLIVNKLELHNVRLTITIFSEPCENQHLKGYTVAYANGSYGVTLYNFPDLEETKLTLAHELIHVMQAESGNEFDTEGDIDMKAIDLLKGLA